MFEFFCVPAATTARSMDFRSIASTAISAIRALTGPIGGVVDHRPFAGDATAIDLFGVEVDVVHAVAVIVLVELQIVQRILEVVRRRIKALDLNRVLHRLGTGVELGFAHLLAARLAQCHRQAPLNGPTDFGVRGQACVGHP